MSEDVSQQVRLAVTIVLAAMCITTTASLLMIGSIMLADFTDNYVRTANMQNTSAFNALNNSTTPISTPVVYRILEEKRSVIVEVRITWKNGTTVIADTYDEIEDAVAGLLKSPEKSVNVVCKERSNGYYITVTEE